MRENKLAEMSMDFSVQIINLVKELNDKCTSIRVMLVASCKTAKENMK